MINLCLAFVFVPVGLAGVVLAHAWYHTWRETYKPIAARSIATAAAEQDELWQRLNAEDEKDELTADPQQSRKLRDRANVKALYDERGALIEAKFMGVLQGDEAQRLEAIEELLSQIEMEQLAIDFKRMTAKQKLITMAEALATVSSIWGSEDSTAIEPPLPQDNPIAPASADELSWIQIGYSHAVSDFSFLAARIAEQHWESAVVIEAMKELLAEVKKLKPQGGDRNNG